MARQQQTVEHNHSETEVNFCPRCGCNIHSVHVSLLFEAQKKLAEMQLQLNAMRAQSDSNHHTISVPPVEERKMLGEATRQGPNSNPVTDEDIARVLKLRDQGIRPRDIIIETKMLPSRVNYILYQLARRKTPRPATVAK